MKDRYMLLPAKHSREMRLLRLPEDLDGQAAYRCATAIIAELEEQSPGKTSEDIEATFEEHGFAVVDFMMGPTLD